MVFYGSRYTVFKVQVLLAWALQPNTYFIKGDDGGEDTPLPFPNRVVKLASADGTAGSPRGRVGRRPFFLPFWRLRVADRSVRSPPVYAPGIYSSRHGFFT